MPSRRRARKCTRSEAAPHCPASAATYTALQHRKGIIVVGEPGVGKTALGATLAIALRPHMKPDQVVIVTSPPHPTGKWQREVEALRPINYDGMNEAADLIRYFGDYRDGCEEMDNPAEARRQLLQRRLSIGCSCTPTR